MNIFAYKMYIYSTMGRSLAPQKLKWKDGSEILKQDFIQSLRDADRKIPDKLKIIPQKGAQERMLAIDADIKIVGGSRGGPLLVDTKVVTPFGYRRIGDLKSGDIISGTDGGMQRVVYNKKHGKLPSYKLKFIDGSEVVASYDHLWNVRKTCYISKKRKLNNLSLQDDFRVWTTQMIVDHLTKAKNGEIKNSRLIIPLCEPIKFTRGWGNRHYKPTIDPYIIGALIGDGCVTEHIKNGSYDALLSSADKEVVDEFEQNGFDMSNWSQKDGNAAKDYRIIDSELRENLFGLKLYGHDAFSKFVPEVYKWGSIEVRLAIVQGLMDTDGTVDKRGHCSFTTVSEQLAKDMKFLINSLGGLATISRHKSHYVKNGKRVEASDSYDVYIRINDGSRLFRLPRKKNRCTEYNGGISDLGRHIVGFEYIGEEECCCIAVNNTNSLFLVEDFIVTHNSKSFSSLMEALKDIRQSDFHALILRNEKDDLQSLVSDSYKLYSQFGTYNKSQNDMTWNFQNGGWLKFSYYAGTYQDFKTRFQGRQYAYIAIDEGTQVEYKKFKYLLTNNRNASHIRNRFWITCNPDPESWVRKFIDWWVDEDGYIIPERDCKVRFCFMDGDTPDQIYWGDTREEVYNQCSSIIDSLWKESYEELGYTKLDMFIKSVTFIRADVSENIKLISTDASYIANLAQQDEEQRMRDLEANWNWKAAGDDLVKIADLEEIFHNAEQLDDEVHRASADIAFTGGDNFVMWHWIGRHTKDLVVMRLDSKMVVSVVQAKLREWGVEECNFTYDMQGIGQYFKGFFPDAVPFNNQAAPIALNRKEEEGIKYLYKDLKSQCAFLFYTDIKDKSISIEPALLDRKFSGNGFKNLPLRQILMKERKSLRRDDKASDKGFKLLPKKLAKRYVGHSPDFWESWFYIEIFKLIKKKHKKAKGLWMLS